jgi:5-bromo-4-chloroindolyl phosphate hydrolysis protein
MLQEEKFALLQAKLVKAKTLNENLHETRQLTQQNNSPPN